MLVLGRRLYCLLVVSFVLAFVAVLVVAVVEKILAVKRSHEDQILIRVYYYYWSIDLTYLFTV